MSHTYTNNLLDIGGFVGTPIDGWPTHGEPAPNRVDVYRADPLTTNIVDELCDGLLQSDAASAPSPTKWTTTTVQPELYWVEKFIKDYKLDAGQKATAMSILKEYKAYADAYRQVKKDDYARARKQVDQARKDHDIEKLKAAEKRIDKLNERISEFLAQMKERLMAIPRESQKRAYAEQTGQEPERDAAKGDQGAADKPADEPSKEQAKPAQPSPETTGKGSAEKTKEGSKPRK